MPSWRQPNQCQDLTPTMQAAKKQKLAGMMLASIKRNHELRDEDVAGFEMQERRAAFEWCISYQNALSITGVGLERTMRTEKELKELKGCDEWEQEHTCIDNGSDGKCGHMSLSRSRFFHWERLFL